MNTTYCGKRSEMNEPNDFVAGGQKRKKHPQVLFSRSSSREYPQ
jgi:hypothetical protein